MKPALLMLAALSLWSALFGYEVKMRVVDDQGQAVPNADATIAFIGYIQGSGTAHTGKTDQNGVFHATGRAKDSVFLVADKAGYYPARERLPKDKDINYTIVLPRILQPVPLYANRFNLGSGLRGLIFPVHGEWLGFDFEIGDWVAPHGKGKITDIRFKFKNEFLGWKLSEEKMVRSRQIDANLSETEFKNSYGKWDAELEISFPGEKEGLHEETGFLKYSRLKLPHKAPEQGYVPGWRYTENTYSPRSTRENVGFFLRTRVKLDKEGKIASANYSKLRGDFELAPTGSLTFWYYFNPVPNDRNLEFDPEHNLFPASFPGANVGDP